QAFGDDSAQNGRGVAFDESGNVLAAADLLGSVELNGDTLTSAGGEDILVGKLDSGGILLLGKGLGGEGAQYVHDVATNGSEILLGGSFRESLDFGGGPLSSQGAEDIYIAKLDSSGGYLWSKSFGDPSAQGASAVAVDRSGNTLITGELFGSADFG